MDDKPNWTKRGTVYVELAGNKIALETAMTLKRGNDSIRKAAEKVALDEATYFRAEQGRLPSVPVFLKIIRWLDVPNTTLSWEPKPAKKMKGVNCR